MPKTDPETKRKRIELVYRLLERHPNGLTEREIADMLNMERRNVNNYLRALEIEGKLYKDGRAWFVLPYERVRLRRFELSPEEAMTLYLATRLLAKQHDKRNESAETALIKLAEVLTGDAGVGHEIHQAALELAHRPGDERYSQVFRTIMQSYIYRRKAAITYHPMNSDPFQTVLSPYLLEPSAIGYATYVIGQSSIVGTLRTYKLERIEQATLTSEEYTVPTDFPGLDILRHAWSIIHGEKLNPVRLRFHPRVTRRVRESRWHPSQDIADDPDNPGGCIWTAQVADLTDLLPWVRGWGADVEVLGPVELREELVKEAKRLARVYEITTSAQNLQVIRLLKCWGKTGKQPMEFHPALFHMLDVGSVARALLRDPASPRWRRVLADALNADPEILADWLPYFVALHDVGKISMAFQGLKESHKQRLEAEGFSFGMEMDLHHSLIGQIFISHALAQVGGVALPDTLKRAVSDAVGAHHGRFIAPEMLKTARTLLKNYEPSEWSTLRLTVAENLQPYLLLQTPTVWPEPPNISTAIMALTGFIILCDWLGSDNQYFAPQSDSDLDEYAAESMTLAQRAVEAAGLIWTCQSSAPTSFASLFSDKQPPRPFQEAIDVVPDDLLTGPCLAILEAPTGEGKTEAALALAHRLGGVRGTDEMYYALPTMATSNQMFIRLQKHLRDRLGLPTQVKLVHGQAFLVEDDLCLDPLGNDESSNEDAALEWFGPKKRALLAPFGVGTVDQVELAVLNVKHTALRMIGLAGKVVIFDEVHAYDTYMTTIVESLLKWLRALDTSVIILSATLPQARRAALARAYGVEMDVTLGEADAYPSLWVLGAKGQHHAAPSAQQPNRKLTLQTLHIPDSDPEAKARWLLDAVSDEGCVCWMTNTVARAQQVFEIVDQLAAPEIERMLLHAQFPLEEREGLEKELRDKYGLDGKRPERGIVIGTQVLEQSLDLDFDVMVSDLAPIDLLLQRAGRLHRHDRSRPAGHAEPRLWVNVLLDADSNLKLDVDRWIYAPFVLRQTWATIAELLEIVLPRDYRPLVEAVYGVTELSLDSLLLKEWQDLKQKEANAIGEANLRLLPDPDPEWAFSSRVARLVFEENENSASWIVAQTRLGEESVRVIPLQRKGDLAQLFPGDDGIEIDRAAPRKVQLRLLRRHLRISNQAAVQVLKAEGETLPPLFTKSALLKEYLPLWLTDGQARFPLRKGTLVLTLDRKLGLIIRKEGI